ncbi:hypothetical protein [Spirulina sp. 06S082]|uniref:hypothetical protein n=1 Tax=Spirulina sp. 06S082 TaxID=3110248 RepID=UPI002B21F1CE|nr:hypothetical protein [Spirulina sp. 06S082]MEA5468354.1 hypothetical protein [Spirulina sp. 06S082]
MFRRSLLVASLAIAGTCVFASSTKAQPTTGDVDFSGVVTPSACTWEPINSKTPGVLAPNPALDTLTTTIPASIEIECPLGATLTIGDPVPGANPAPSNDTAWVDLGANTAYSPAHPLNGGFPSLPVPAGSIENLSISMEAISVAPQFAAGTYTYTVTLTATP